MEFKTATMADFDVAFDYIEKLWTYNTYDKEVIRTVYADVLADENSFAFFLMDGDTYHGFCHGAYFNTFWLSGMTCYVSSIITNEDERGKGCGVKLMDHAKELAKARGCKALVLDSGMPRTQAHRFYEIYGNLPRKNRHLPPGRCRFFGVLYRVFPDIPLQKKKSL